MFYALVISLYPPVVINTPRAPVIPVFNINVFIFGMKIEAQRLRCEVGEDEKWNVQFHISQLNSTTEILGQVITGRIGIKKKYLKPTKKLSIYCRLIGGKLR